MIPRIFHRVWIDDLGDDPVPEQFDGYWKRFHELHPDWQFVTWRTSESLSWMRCREVFDQAETWAGKSDVARYEIIAKYGGVYVDTDVEPLRPFDDLIADSPFAAWEDHNMICPTVIGSPAHHPAMEALIERLPGWARRHRGKPPNLETGPYFLTHTWRHRKDVRLLDPVAFYPVHWSRKRDLGNPYPPESYAVHHWSAGWLPDGPPQR